MTERDRYADAIASLARSDGFRVGVAESLTCGQLAAHLGAAANASEWFRGGVVAYAPEVKFDVLGVTPGRVVTAACAREMAEGAAKVLEADATVAATGVGGPDDEEGEPPGTVYVAARVRGHEECLRFQFAGDPADVLRQTVQQALELLLSAMRESREASDTASKAGSGVPPLHD